MKNKITILTSGHPPFDERIYWKFARSLASNGFEVSIISSIEIADHEEENILIKGFDGTLITKKEKINFFFDYLQEFQPHLIICCEPLTILPAHKYKKRLNKKCVIISDITEWYPNHNTLKLFKGIKFFLKYIQLFLFNVYTSNLTDHLIIGEEEKAKLYRYIAPFKKQTIIGYYPPLELFNFAPPQFDGRHLTLCFTGSTSSERGYYRFTSLIKKLALLTPDIQITAKIVGNIIDVISRKELDMLSGIYNVVIQQTKPVSYDMFSDSLSDADICIDLRDKNKLFDNSLPIKIFDYMASGKLVIFSNLKSFYQLPEVEEFGLLIDPEDDDAAIDRILNYINNPELMKAHSLKARHLFETKYNWEMLEKKLIKLLRDLLSEHLNS